MVVIRVQNSASLQIVATLPRGALQISPLLQGADEELLVFAMGMQDSPLLATAVVAMLDWTIPTMVDPFSAMEPIAAFQALRVAAAA